MAQKATGIHLIAGKEPLRKSIYCHIEYDRGELYFDRAGRLFRRWDQVSPGWEAPTVSGGQVTAVHLNNEWVGEFRPNGASISLNMVGTDRVIDDAQLKAFAVGSAALFGELVDEFELPRFTLLGYRELYHFPAESVEDSSKWVRRLGLCPIPPAVLAAFGPNYHAQTSALVLFSDDCRYRIEVQSLEGGAKLRFGTADISFRESVAKRLGKGGLLAKLKSDRSRQLNPMHIGQVDLEAFLWNGVETDYEIADFVHRHGGELLAKFRQCVTETESRDV